MADFVLSALENSANSDKVQSIARVIRATSQVSVLVFNENTLKKTAYSFKKMFIFVGCQWQFVHVDGRVSRYELPKK